MTIPNEKLQRARLQKRWSVAVASRRARVSTNTFNRWERGLQIPQLATLDQLCAAFEMSAEDLGFGYVVSPQKRTETELLLEEDVENVSPVFPSPVLFTSMAERPLILNSMARRCWPVRARQVPLEQAQGEHFSRRQVIAALIGTPAAIFGAPQSESISLLRVEEILTLCASHIPLCWQLYFEGGMADVEQVLPDYIAQLSNLALHPAPYQKRAASLLSQAYQLASLMATQHQDYGRAYTNARQALFYGELAEDPNLQVASWIRCALVQFYLKRERPRLHAYQHALQLVSQTSPLLQGRTYIGMAEIFSKLSQEDEARRFLELAQTTFPLKAEEDPNYAYTHFTFTSISTFEGLMHLNLNQPEQAQQAFERIDRSISREVVPNRLELIVHLAFTSCALGELEQTSKLIEMAVPMAHSLGSQLRADQAYEVYEQVLSKWGDEQMIKDLEELFRLYFFQERETSAISR
jgi:transcriptional regulator with XRE-family HTH domain/tetratricopeptide (TPR) repeat protein